jgi:hypothetical protein
MEFWPQSNARTHTQLHAAEIFGEASQKFPTPFGAWQFIIVITVAATISHPHPNETTSQLLTLFL